jgi:NADH:ubiquinone oxidoreductase subunit 6 (subunit J)
MYGLHQSKVVEKRNINAHLHYLFYPIIMKRLCILLYPTNKKGQMPPQLLITLTRGIQIRGQPIKKLQKKIFSNFLKFFEMFFYFHLATF